MSARIAHYCIAAILSLWGCGSPDESTATTAEQAILGGDLSGPEDDNIVQVVSTIDSTTHRCSGALVAPNLVLTARHCVASYIAGVFDCDANGELVSGPGGAMGAVATPDTVTIQVGAAPASGAVDAKVRQIFALQTTTICRNDIALLLLDRTLETIPVLPLRLSRTATRGEKIAAIGYGIFEFTAAGIGVRHRKDDLVVTKVGKSQLNPDGDNIPPRSFQIDGGVLCISDSGGPALAESGAVVGVYSKSNGDCSLTTTVNWYTETAPFLDELIQPAFDAAGHKPIREEVTTGGSGYGGQTSAPTAGSAGDPAGAAGSVAAGGHASDSSSLSGGRSSEVSGPAGSSAKEELLYEGAPPSGGSCGCRAAGSKQANINWALLSTTLLLVGRRKPKTYQCSNIESSGASNTRRRSSGLKRIRCKITAGN